MWPHPPSTHITLISTTDRISKSNSQARTPTASNRSSSAVSSHKHPKVTNAESTMANAAAMMTMTSVLNQVTDCMLNFQSILTVPSLTSTTSPQTLPLPQTLPPPQPLYWSLAISHLNNDIILDPAIHTELFLEFILNDVFCQMYTELEDPMLHHKIAVSWYQKHHM